MIPKHTLPRRSTTYPTAESPARWRALAFLSIALVLAMTTWFSATAVVPQLREEWRLSDAAAAWLTIAVQLGFVAGALVSAVTNLPDVLPARVVLVASAVAAAAVNVGIYFADGPGLAIPLRFLTGFFLAGVYPVALKLMATWFQKGRGTALGALVGALTLGTAAPHFVNAAGGLEWRTVIVVTSVLTAAGAALIATAVFEGPFPFPQATFDPRQTRRVFGRRRVLLASAGYFGHMWELYAMWAWFIVFLRASLADAGQSDGATAAVATFAVIASGAIGCWLGGVLGDRWGRPRVTAGMMLVSGACSLSIGLTFGGPLWLVLAVGILWGISVVGDSAQFSTLVTEHADPRYVGTAVTLQLAVGFTLTVVTIWLMPWLAEQVTWRWAFAALAVGPALGVVAMRALSRTIASERSSAPVGNA